MNPVVRKLRGAARRMKAAVAPRAVILLYHRVADAPPGTDPFNLCVSPARFAEQMEALSRRVPVLPLGEVVKRIAERRLPKRCAAVTFDDGYADNLHTAKPILARHGVPATVFVTSGDIGRAAEFYWDECEQLAPAGPAAAERSARCIQQCDAIRELRPARRRETMDGFRRGAGRAEPVVRDTHRAMSDDEVRRLAADGLIDVGAHTENHPALPSLPAAEQLGEIARSKARLEDVLGRPVAGFAYPYGLHTAKTVHAVRSAGFTYACTTEEHAARHASEELCLPRFDIGDCDGETFEKKLHWAFGR